MADVDATVPTPVDLLYEVDSLASWILHRGGISYALKQDDIDTLDRISRRCRQITKDYEKQRREAASG